MYWWTVDSGSIYAFERPFALGIYDVLVVVGIGSDYYNVTGFDPTTIHKSLMITRIIFFFLRAHFLDYCLRKVVVQAHSESFICEFGSLRTETSGDRPACPLSANCYSDTL